MQVWRKPPYKSRQWKTDRNSAPLSVWLDSTRNGRRSNMYSRNWMEVLWLFFA